MVFKGVSLTEFGEYGKIALAQSGPIGPGVIIPVNQFSASTAKE
jgi:hypothetical protein